MSRRYSFLDHDGVLAFSHRGGSSDWPENTMPSFQYSIDLGINYLETDVHLSADGILFAFHDNNLKARTGVDANIADLDAHDIDRLLVDGRARVPRLDEVMVTWPLARLNIDTKSDAAVLPLIAAVRAHHALDRVCIGSFSDRRIKKCRTELGPDLCTSMGRHEATRLVLASRGFADPTLLVAPCAQLPRRRTLEVLTPQLIELAHDHDIQVHAWTINQPDDMRQLLDLGVDGLMTDKPRVLRDVLIDQGRWSSGYTREQRAIL